MSRYRSSDWTDWVWPVICVLVLVAGMASCVHEASKQATCNQQGGVYVKQALGYICVKPAK